MLGVAAVAHLTFYAATPPVLWADSERFANHGFAFLRALRRGGWDHWTPPAYPALLRLILVATDSPAGVALVQQVLAIATCWIVWRAARRLFAEGPALLGAVLVALAPARHYYAQTLLSESLAELLLTLGTASLVFAADAPPRRMLAWRALAGIALGAAALTRTNLLPAGLLACLLPTWPSRCAPIARGTPPLLHAAGAPPIGSATGSARTWPAAIPGMAATALCLALVLTPWLAFNARRGIYGITGNAGWQLTTFANARQVGEPIDISAYRQGEGAGGRSDMQLALAAFGRIARHPAAYLAGVWQAAIGTMGPWSERGDVVREIPSCRGLPPKQPLRGFSAPVAGDPDPTRCAVHAVLCAAVEPLITLGWIGLAVWAATALRAGRPDAASVAAVPLVCIAALVVLLHSNTRFAFPFEALALGVGVPALLERLRARVFHRSGAAPSRSARPTGR